MQKSQGGEVWGLVWGGVGGWSGGGVWLAVVGGVGYGDVNK